VERPGRIPPPAGRCESYLVSGAWSSWDRALSAASPRSPIMAIDRTPSAD